MQLWIAFSQKYQGRVTDALTLLGVRDNEEDNATTADTPVCHNHLLHNYLLLDTDFLEERDIPYVYATQESCDVMVVLSGTFYETFATGVSYSEVSLRHNFRM